MGGLVKKLTPKQQIVYDRIMDDFRRENKNKPAGLMGSYCQAGQEYFAYNVAIGYLNSIPRQEVKP